VVASLRRLSAEARWTVNRASIEIQGYAWGSGRESGDDGGSCELGCIRAGGHGRAGRSRRGSEGESRYGDHSCAGGLGGRLHRARGQFCDDRPHRYRGRLWPVAIGGRAGVLARVDSRPRRRGRTLHGQHSDGHGLGLWEGLHPAAPTELGARLCRKFHRGLSDRRRRLCVASVGVRQLPSGRHRAHNRRRQSPIRLPRGLPARSLL